MSLRRAYQISFLWHAGINYDRAMRDPALRIALKNLAQGKQHGKYRSC